MRLWLRLLITLVVLAGIGLGTWVCWNRRQLAFQWASYRVGAAQTFEEACAQIAWFESEPDQQAKLRELVGKWGTGNQRFDLHLARYVGDPESSEALRKAFSLGFAWHDDRLPRWAHYWSWQSSEEPDREVASILAYLDLVAVFCLAGEPQLAKRLDPENWRDRYRRWRAKNRGERARVARPGKPFPDWRGPLP
jgi:hypothetical protein